MEAKARCVSLDAAVRLIKPPKPVLEAMSWTDLVTVAAIRPWKGVPVLEERLICHDVSTGAKRSRPISPACGIWFSCFAAACVSLNQFDTFKPV
ncbi:hypothetical protein CMUS01_07502 [Colletotrichum musicola]|uniref:Uncharacterized protein n=1 Tax=Colletotrichum musicola TaxID=2175873 RepID=A0A8H6KGJ0_9PEZI|nr:hypothetical protein CMUS01_07502 [Colletotrichum musicola]